MCQLFESIRIEDGKIHHLELHQERVNRSVLKLGGTSRVNLNELTDLLVLPKKGLYKLRISYDINGIKEHQVSPYIIKSIKSVELVEDHSVDYSLKYEDRTQIKLLKDNSKADEIIIVKKRLITDSSISNILFFDGTFWYTPSKPLLEGTQRAFLIHQNYIKIAPIEIGTLHNFSHFSFINALNPFDSAEVHSINKVINI